MKFFYSMILLLVVMSVNASEKKLKTRLEAQYDLQLAQRKKEIESRKLLASVAKKNKKTNVRDDQRKSINDNNDVKIKQNQNKQRIKKNLHQSSLFQHYSPVLDVLVTACVMPVIGMLYYSSIVNMPIGCYSGSNICTCLGM